MYTSAPHRAKRISIPRSRSRAGIVRFSPSSTSPTSRQAPAAHSCQTPTPSSTAAKTPAAKDSAMVAKVRILSPPSLLLFVLL